VYNDFRYTNEKIFVYGESKVDYYADWNCNVTSINRDGTLNTSFNSTGVSTVVYDNHQEAGKMVIDTNGNIYTAYLDKKSNQYVYLNKHLPNGDRDIDFGSYGRAYLTSGKASIKKVKLTQKGNIAVLSLKTRTVYLSSTTPKGDRDSSFAVNGIFTMNIDNFIYPTDFVELKDSSFFIMIARECSTSVVKIDKFGVIDSSFGDLGVQTILGFEAFTIEVLNDRDVLIGGTNGAEFKLLNGLLSANIITFQEDVKETVLNNKGLLIKNNEVAKFLQAGTASVFNLNGQLLWRSKVQKDSEVKLSPVKGVLFIQLQTEKGEFFVEKYLMK
jgi:hypothetical protein